MDKQTLTRKFLEEVQCPDIEGQFKKYLWLWWANPVSSTSLRLTDHGADLLSNVLKLQSYSHKFPKEFKKTTKMLLLMDKHLSTPYFICGQSITFFGERDTIMLALMNNDLRLYLENFTL